MRVRCLIASRQKLRYNGRVNIGPFVGELLLSISASAPKWPHVSNCHAEATSRPVGMQPSAVILQGR